MELPLRFQLKPSRSYLMFLAGGHILAGVAVCLLPFPFLLRAGLLLLLVLLLVRQWHVASRRLPGLLLRRDGRLEVLHEAEDALVVRVGADTVVWPCLVVLHLEGEAETLRPLVLLPDSLSQAEAYRQLRLWLRWRKSPEDN